MSFIGPLIESLRPKQWIKNVFLFAALIFSRNLDKPLLIIKTLAAFVCFCALSSSIYLINDLLDLEQDKLHPTKSKRPLPSGRLKKGVAVQASIILAICAITGAYTLNSNFGIIALIYFILFCIYSVKLKSVVILDVMTIALGFVLRVMGGGLVIKVEVSNWLLICTILLALFLGLSKRRHELILLNNNAANHRSILAEYSPYFLDQMISVVTACTVMAYSLYTMSPETINKFHTQYLSATIPFVLYGIFRYLYLVHQKQAGGSPTKILLTDKPLIFNSLLWIVSAILIIYL